MNQIDILESVKKLQIDKGDVVLIKGGILYKEVEMLKKRFKDSGKSNLVIVVDDSVDIEVLDEHKMNLHGWYKKKL